MHITRNNTRKISGQRFPLHIKLTLHPNYDYSVKVFFKRILLTSFTPSKNYVQSLIFRKVCCMSKIKRVVKKKIDVSASLGTMEVRHMKVH